MPVTRETVTYCLQPLLMGTMNFEFSLKINVIVAITIVICGFVDTMIFVVSICQFFNLECLFWNGIILFMYLL